MAGSAKAVALRFLQLRPRSIAEIRVKLQDKKFTKEDIESAVNDLVVIGLLDDRAFTKSWITYRLARPFGFRRIITELRMKGIAEDIVEQSIREVRGDTDEMATAEDLAQRRWKRLSSIEPQKAKKRVLDFLVRRGFSIDTAIKVIRKLK